MVDSMIKTGKEIRELNHHGSINGVRVTRMRFCSCVPLAEQLREIADDVAKLDAVNNSLRGLDQWVRHPALEKLLALVVEIEGKK